MKVKLRCEMKPKARQQLQCIVMISVSHNHNTDMLDSDTQMYISGDD